MNTAKNILLDPESTTGYTEDNGEVMLNLRLFKGLPGQYNLQFEAQEIQSKKSSIFELRNRIDKVEVIYDINQTLSVDLLDTNQEPITLFPQPRLKIYYNEEQFKITKKYIDVTIYK